MQYQVVDGSREYVARLAHGEDWRGQIEAFAREEGIEAGFFFGLGAVADAELYFYDQETTVYDPVAFDEPFEVTACVGNLSMLDGEPFAHTHVTLSREDGSALGGHLNRATTFAGELYVQAFDASLVRERDATTDLDLWEL